MSLKSLIKNIVIFCIIVFVLAIIVSINGIRKCRLKGGGLYHYFSGKCDNIKKI
jgi:hypothetical protein